jgi:hypothetical protein
MQMAITFVAVVGGMMLSLAVALLAEELIFGQLIRVFFVARSSGACSIGERRSRALRRKGERQCWH